MTSESIASPHPDHNAPDEPPSRPPTALLADEPPPLLPLSSPPAPAAHPFVFHGNARDYFRIWIVNTLLTLLTVGIYFAWAKVRKRRYLRGNTELMGHRFDYRADPARILIGNVIVALLFLTYMVVGEVYPGVRFGAIAVGLVLVPWVIMRSLAFNAHNTVYRGMRFFSRRTYGATAVMFVGQGLVAVISAGFFYPAWIRNRKQFVIESHRLGDAFFRFEAKAGPFYKAYVRAGMMIFGAVVLGGFLTMSMARLKLGGVTGGMMLIIPLALYLVAWFCAKQFLYAQLFNQVWNNTRLDEHRFISTMDSGRWLKLQFVNLGALLVSCGLLYPWATIRSTRYALACLQFVPAGPLEKISRLGRSDGSAVGETAAEFVGLDIGL